MQLTDLITPREEETIKHYIQLNTNVAEPAALPILFSVWNKQKRTLYKALGRNLRIKFPINVPRNALAFKYDLQNLYETYPIWDKFDATYFLGHETTMRQQLHNDFVFEFLKFIAEQDWCNEDRYHASRLIMHQNIEKGYISTIGRAALGSVVNDEYHFQAFKATVKDNMRTVRTIQKVLKAMHFPKMELFEEWRNKVSDLNINQDLKANLVFSIHPIDFMTLSDNNCGWSSCMSWTASGSYSAGTIEMMNSNLAIVAYLESETPYNIIFDDEKFNIPNKSWRSLFYINKNILLAGKAYPYYNENLTKECLNLLRVLLKNNLGWEYQYINQPYKDNLSINNNFFLKYSPRRQFDRPKDKTKKKHAIYVYTNTMYNDLVEYKDVYWCCRNWVPKTIKLCLSGLATCMCCGEPIQAPSYIESYDTIGNEKICDNCYRDRNCSICNSIKYSPMLCSYHQTKYSANYCCSERCLEELIYIPSQDIFIKKEEAFFDGYFVIGSSSNFLKSPEVQFFVADHSGWHRRGYQETIKDLMNDPFIKKNAIIVKVPYWIFNDSEYCYTYSSINGYTRRPFCRNIKFFDLSENFDKRNIFQRINEYKKWIPAKEVI